MAVDDSDTKNLLHLDGTDASTTITDESGKTWTARGNAQIDTAQSKFGGASLLLDGTGDWIDTPDHADFNVGTGSVTYDFWVRFNSVAAGCVFVSQYQDANNVLELSWAQTTNKIYCYQYQSSAYAVRFEAAWTPSTNTWYHIEIARSSSAAYIFVDGTLLTTTVTNGSVATSWNDLTGVFAVGAENGNASVNGWIDEFRYSRVVRHTSNFTPPTSAYSPVTRDNPPFKSVQFRGGFPVGVTAFIPPDPKPQVKMPTAALPGWSVNNPPIFTIGRRLNQIVAHWPPPPRFMNKKESHKNWFYGLLTFLKFPYLAPFPKEEFSAELAPTQFTVNPPDDTYSGEI